MNLFLNLYKTLGKRILIALFYCVCTLASFATHIAGGEINYTYAGQGSAAGTSRYNLTMRLYRECASTGQVLNGETVTLGFYNSSTHILARSLPLTMQWSGNPPQIQNNAASNPCLNPQVTVCYQIGTFSGSIDLPDNAEGYDVEWARYTRTALTNTSPSGNWGAGFLTKIPGTTALPTGHNNSPVFIIKDTTVICKSTSFTLDYSATDVDNDSLAYKFTAPYDGFGGSANSPSPFTPTPPTLSQLAPLTFASGYTGTTPLGGAATIDVHTGLISGIAPPAAGKYVICVMAEEWRNGVLINTHRKDFIVSIGDCGLTGANLGPDQISCDGFTWTFSNQSTNSSIAAYLWTFGDGGTSTDPVPSHTYTDTGVYTIKLKVQSTGGCQDSSTTHLRVFPGFFPGFTSLGICKDVPFLFFDTTKTIYGTVNKWSWDFGQITTLADSSHVKNPSYLYPDTGIKVVTLIVGNSEGCIDTVTANVTVILKPVLTLPFHDTLICSIDTLQLFANGIGSFAWSPNFRIVDPTVQNPYVFPNVTTRYSVTLSNQGCINSDTVRVNVLSSITADAGPDTTICRTDGVTLNPTSQGLGYTWTPTTYLNNSNIKNPISTPTVPSITYHLVANLGKCTAEDDVTIKTIPYPTAFARPDTVICFNTSVLLYGSGSGISYTWSPASLVQNPTSLVTTAFPKDTTIFTLSVYDTLGCPKPGTATTLVSVVPAVQVFAGNDTSIVINQPLVFQSTASSFATSFSWSPSTGLNSTTALQPTAVLNNALLNGAFTITYTLTASTAQGCKGSDDVTVKIFKTLPSIFVPSAFTPNGDGKNDVIKPILAGISQLQFFRIFNRFGQLVFETANIGRGWDGRINGELQGTATYVYSAQALDYNNEIVKQNGTFVLVR